MPKIHPSISIVMPVWNGGKYIREAIDGILAQSFADFELVVVDDGSTDDTISIVESYSDERIKVVKQGKRGFVCAVNRGVEESSAEWIARHDADDVSHPMRLEIQWAALLKNPKAVLCFCNVDVFGINAPTQATRWFPKSHSLIALRSCHQCPVVVGAALIKRSMFFAAGGYREEEFPAEDYAFASRLLRLGRFVGCPEILYSVRVHESQISQVKRQAQIEKTKLVALQNCRDFFRISEDRVQEVYGTLCQDRECQSLSHCLRLLFYLLTFRCQSVELWIWAANRLRRAL